MNYQMRLIPLHGTSEILFGASYNDVIGVLGSPDAEEQLHDIESHPKRRRHLTYGDFYVAVGSEIGVFGIGVRASSEPLMLWDTKINDLSTQEFAAFLKSQGANCETAPLTAWRTTDVYSADYGILAYFANERLSEIQIQIPYSCPTKY